MATLLLTAVGSAIAGPIGAAIGAMAGQRVDQALLGGQGRQGARLADLSVQSSTYGASIPRIYGRMRVSGTVIWATDLREERHKVSQGKGRPKATVFSYSASFAVLLSGRPAGRIGRIWADGKLLRGAAGDFKVETGFRFHSGLPDQAVDPLIASADGAAAPAYRGRAYAVFEDMALESFGNRIPMLSFEVIADDRDIATTDLVTDLADRGLLARPTQARFQGVVADGGTIRVALNPFEAVDPIGWRDDGSKPEIGRIAGPPILVRHDDTGASPNGEAVPRLARTRSSSLALPSRAQIGFADVARDYQSGLQSVDLHIEGGVVQSEIPAALSAGAARQMAADRLFNARREGVCAELRVPWRCLAIWQAPTILLDGVVWQVRRLRFESMCLVLDLATPISGDRPLLPADAGRATMEQDAPAGETVLQLVDLPTMGDAAPSAPQIVVAAAGREPSWRSAVLLVRTDNQTNWQEIRGAAAPAVMGRCMDTLAAGSAHLLDMANTLTVELLHDEVPLLSAEDTALHAGANAAMVGAEVIQFGRVEKTGPRHWRLSRLLRGRRGTEADIATHGADEGFLLLDPDAFIPLPIALGSRSVDVLAKGVGDPTGVQARCDIAGNAVRPLSPVHVRWERMVDGGVRITWVRRSREGWRWLDLVDVPLGEESERYRIVAATAAGPITFETTTSALELSASFANEMAAAGLSALPISIVQIGRFAVSLPLTALVPS